MKELSDTVRQQARMIIVCTVDYAVKPGKLGSHRLDGIELVTTGTKRHRAGFVFPTHVYSAESKPGALLRQLQAVHASARLQDGP